MIEAVISGTGLFTPPESITNDELVDAYNQYVKNFNDDNRDEIESGAVEALPFSSKHQFHVLPNSSRCFLANS